MNPMSLLTLPLSVHRAAAAHADRESPSGERRERWSAMVIACLVAVAAFAVQWNGLAGPADPATQLSC